jgi:hypothetical protein
LPEATLISVKPEQRANAALPMEVTLAGMLMLVKLQEENAPFPMEITLAGMLMLAKRVFRSLGYTNLI